MARDPAVLRNMARDPAVVRNLARDPAVLRNMTKDPVDFTCIAYVWYVVAALAA